MKSLDIFLIYSTKDVNIENPSEFYWDLILFQPLIKLKFLTLTAFP
jgi:hypothetical protein